MKNNYLSKSTFLYSTAYLMFIAEPWRLLELNDLLWFHAPHLRVKDIMEVTGQAIILHAMKTCIYPFQVSF